MRASLLAVTVFSFEHSMYSLLEHSIRSIPLHRPDSPPHIWISFSRLVPPGAPPSQTTYAK